MAADVAKEAVYRVAQELAELRRVPSLEGDIAGQVPEGTLLQGTVHRFDEEPWLELHARRRTFPVDGVSAEEDLWTPIAVVMSFGNIDMLEFVEEVEVLTPEQEEAIRKQKELEEKALQALDSVLQAAKAAESCLAQPLKYAVCAESPTYRQPLPQAKRFSQVSAGREVAGFPGGAAWVRLATGGPAAMLGEEEWAPVRSTQPERDLVLRAMWSELEATKVTAKSIEVSWPGFQAKPPLFAEYVLEWRPHTDPPTKSVSGRVQTPKPQAKIDKLSGGEELQLRVSGRAAGGGAELKLTGPWVNFRTPDAGALGEGEGEGLYEVVNKLLMLRCEPSRKGRACGSLKQGHQVYGSPFDIGGEPWIKLSTPQPLPEGRDVMEGESCWAMVDATGTDLKLGVLMKRVRDGGPSSASRLGRWRVLHERVVVRSKPDTKADPLGFHLKDAMVKGASLSFEGTAWLRVMFAVAPGVKEQEGWMLIDGSKVGLGQLLERTGDVEETKQASAKGPVRPKPPRPLTASWLTVHGNLPTPASEVREQLLPDSEDVGMASQCSLVWVTPSGGGDDLRYVAKRALKDGDLTTAWREHRFYAELVKESSSTKPATLEGRLRVPRCLLSNWKTGGREDDREHFVILLERLDKPDWVAWDVKTGISYEQAVCAVEALGRFHGAYENPKLLEPLGEWLETTRFGLEHHNGLQHFYGIQLELHRGVLSRLLTPKAMEAAEALCTSGCINHVCSRMGEPPHTLCHGDYRPENLRFSAPGKPQDVACFDWGLANIGRGLDDFTYFIMLCWPPEKRKQHDHELVYKYVEARGWKTDDATMKNVFEDIQASSLMILAVILLTRMETQNAGFFQGTREMLTRMLSWTGQAIVDWNSRECLPY